MNGLAKHITAVVLLWGSLALGRAHAEDLALDYRAPAACPRSSALSSRVRELLSSSQSESSASVAARARIERRGRQFQLTLTLNVDGRAGRRTLRATNCRVLAETAAWLIAVAIDPSVEPPAAPDADEASDEAASEPDPEPPPSEPPPPPEKKPAPKEPDEVDEPARPEHRLTPNLNIVRSPRRRGPRPPLGGRVGLLTGLWSDGLAGVHPTLGARGGLSRGHLYGELRFSHAFARETPLQFQAGVATFSGQVLSGVACAEWGSVLRGGPCLEGSVVRSQGRSTDLVNPTKGGVFWANVGFGAQLRAAVWKNLELSLSGGLDVPFSPRPEFAIEGGQDTFTVSFLNTHLELGVAFQLR